MSDTSSPTLTLQLIAVTGQKMDEQVYEVILPTATGEIAVFPNHESLVTLAKPGVISVRRKKGDTDSAMELFATSGGVIEIDPDRVRILVDEADHGDDIIEAESRKSLERALSLKENASSQVELEQAQQFIDRHQVRLRVAELHRRKRPPQV